MKIYTLYSVKTTRKVVIAVACISWIVGGKPFVQNVTLS